MADIKKPIIILITLIPFVLTACKPQPVPPTNTDSILIRPEQRKMELLDQIRKKYESPQAHYELARTRNRSL